MRFTPCECRAEHYRRVRRSGWMRLISSRRLYHCLACEATLFIPKQPAGDGPFDDTLPGQRGGIEQAEGHSVA
jgi:hypothetical protein